MRLKDRIKPQDLKNVLRYCSLAVCLCVFVFSLVMLAVRLLGYYRDNQKYEQLREQVALNLPREDHTTVATDASSDESVEGAPELLLPYTLESGNPVELNEDGILNCYSALKKQNDQLVGWVRMPGFKNPIDYPVMQSEDNDFYLQNDFYKNFSYAGSIFMDFRNNSAEAGRHIILYGHAMNNRSMFGNLKEFPNRPEDYTKITVIDLDLMNTRLEYEVFSIYFADASDNYRQTSFSSDEEYLSFLEGIQARSVYDYEVELTALDKIITLSTCNNNLEGDMRSVTHARLVRQVIYDKASDTLSVAAASEASQKEIVSANTYLLQLSLNYGHKDKPEEAVFTPPFSTAIDLPYKTFSTQLPPEAESVSLSYKTSDPEAAVNVTLNEKKRTRCP